MTMRNAFNGHSFNYRALEVHFEFVVHFLIPRVGSKFQFNKNNIMNLHCIITYQEVNTLPRGPEEKVEDWYAGSKCASNMDPVWWLVSDIGNIKGWFRFI